MSEYPPVAVGDWETTKIVFAFMIGGIIAAIFFPRDRDGSAKNRDVTPEDIPQHFDAAARRAGVGRHE